MKNLSETSQPDAIPAGGEKEVTEDAFAIDMFWRAVSRFPDDVALEVDGAALSYRSLGEKVFAIQQRLEKDTGAERRIGLLDQRCLSTYAGYLGIMSSGRAVVPLNRKWPRDRLLAVLRMAGTTTLLMDVRRDAELKHDLEDEGYVVHDCGPLVEAPATPGVLPGAGAPRDKAHEAYLLFTSGTTGRPKGVSISEANLRAYVVHIEAMYRLGPGDRASQVFGLTFDPSVHDLFGTLVSGATLVVPTTMEAVLPSRYVRARRLTHWYSVPSAIFLGARFRAVEPGSMPSLRVSLFAGEPLTKEHADLWQAAAPNSAVDNIYGPTEMTVNCTVYRVPKSGVPVTSNRTVPIGHPFPHVPFRIIGDDGDGGELAVGGSQMFGGYLDAADDEGRFIEIEDMRDGVAVKSRFYLTGDRVRWEDGELVHLGRVDRQVKLGGYRIELSEVEAAMREHSGIADLAVAVCGGGKTPHLAAIVVAARPGGPSGRELDAITSLPEHMRPGHAMSVPALPLNGNGKVDHGEIGRLLLADCPREAGS